jgi:isocitrate/isopropylmalate dehydrogenase
LVDSTASKSDLTAVLGGHGIGPEVVATGIKVLRVIEAVLVVVRFELEGYLVGAAE